MPRRRLAVALLLPRPVALEVDGLRRAFGDPARARVAPHVTLVPPTNVAEARVGEAVDRLRAAAARVPGPLRLALGPVASFAPVTPVAYLAVGGDVDALARLQEGFLAPPFDRPRRYPFVPHVTVAVELPPDRLAAVVAAAADFRAEVVVDHVHLLEEGRQEPVGRVWTPIADALLGPPARAGRGSLPVELTVGERLDPDTAARVAPWWGETGSGPRPFALTARRDGTVVGVATGETIGDATVVRVLAVAPAERGTGVGRRLVQEVEAVARRAGAERTVLDVLGPGAADVRAFALGLGYAPAGPAPLSRPV